MIWKFDKKDVGLYGKYTPYGVCTDVGGKLKETDNLHKHKMIKFLRKIPLIIYAILLVGLSIYITRQIEIYLLDIKWLTQPEGEARVALYSSVLTVIGIFYGVMQLQSQRKDSLFANEYINQPEFEFYEFCSNKLLEKKHFARLLLCEKPSLHEQL